jgi:hypothetical protein
MDTLEQALRGAQHRPLAPQPLHALLVVGGGGALGSAVLAETLVAGRFARVQALVAEPLSSSLRDFQPVPLLALEDGTAALAPAAVIVLERQRRSNGRDEAFVQPAPEGLLPLARQLHGRGVQRLLVVVPHAPAMLPQALAKGFASLEELALADVGFEHLVLLRAAQIAEGQAPGSGLQRLARWWLSQLSWMVPQRQQPLRAASLARCVAHLARLLPAVPRGSRVIAPETLWQWAQEEAGLEDALMREFGAAASAGRSPP